MCLYCALAAARELGKRQRVVTQRDTDHLFHGALFGDCPQTQVKDDWVGLFGARFVQHRQSQRLGLLVRAWDLKR